MRRWRSLVRIQTELIQVSKLTTLFPNEKHKTEMLEINPQTNKNRTENYARG